MNTKRTYEEKVKNFMTACDLKEPKWVPLGLDASTWTISYAGEKTYDLLSDPDRLVDTMLKIYKDIDPDFCTDLHCCIRPLKVVQALGGKGYIMSSDEITIQHTMQGEIMHADEYPSLINDVDNFKLNVLPQRKFESVKTREQFKEACLKALEETKKNCEYTTQCIKKAKEAGIIIAWNPLMLAGHPLDEIFDFHRGFKGTLMDLRRQPENVEKAIETLLEQALPINLHVAEQIKTLEEKPLIPIPGSVFHVVPYISRKQFERFWWPTFKKLIMPIIEAGSKIYLRSEGKSGYCLDAFKDLPKGSMIIQLEEDDLYENYKHFDGHMTLAGGIRTSNLKLSTVEECKDIVKKAFDTFAPGGGYIFTSDRPLLGANDANIENLKETYAFAKEYGKY